MADKALLVGINDYKKISDLQGCLNDVENIEKLLVDTFKFSPDNIIKLQNEQVLHDNLVDQFDWLLDKTEAGDRLVFHFSGHGSFINSVNDDEVVDELLCLYDMDWDIQDSFLVDDDLGSLLDGLKEGVHMTVILDTCHSGTGTKAISRTRKLVENPTAKSRMLIIEDTVRTISTGSKPNFDIHVQKAGEELYDAEISPPFARFVIPPVAIQKQIQVAKLNRVGDALRSKALNHQLLAAADATQTAADSFIDNRYQGAFTYHLCKVSRGIHSSASILEIVSSVKSDMRDAGYQQIPQLEGIGQNGKLFGGQETELIEPTLPDIPVSNESLLETSKSEDNGVSDLLLQKNLSRLIQVQEKFLDLANKLLETETATSVSPEFRTTIIGENERIVYIHGINQHRPGFSDGWYAAMLLHLNRTIPKHEIIWSDLVNPRGLLQRSPKLTKDEEKLKQAIEKELNQRKKAIADLNPEFTAASRSLIDGSGLITDDFIRYMTSTETRNQILERFDRMVKPFLERGETLHIISHSWGTVVAYEGLRGLDQTSYAGSVKNLFTLGSALSIAPVQWNLFGRVIDGRRPRYVLNMINMDAGGDLVGGGISGTFNITEEHLGLVPTGCRIIPFTNKALNPACAHSSYFDHENIAINRDIFARWING